MQVGAVEKSKKIERCLSFRKRHDEIDLVIGVETRDGVGRLCVLCVVVCTNILLHLLQGQLSSSFSDRSAWLCPVTASRIWLDFKIKIPLFLPHTLVLSDVTCGRLLDLW